MYVMIMLLTFATCTFATAFDYHQRKIYYNQQDNACIVGTDQVSIDVTFNDRPKASQMMNGNTFCQDYDIFYQSRISPGQYMTYHQCYNEDSPDDFYCDKIVFVQKATYHYVGLWITSIVQKATIRNPASFDNNQYNCEIEGDGTVQHFGPFRTIPVPRVEVKCTRIPTNIRKEAS